jgi:2-polyprenyl-3-methyl-5-hydroxy-6-metoxy-1,4-benzoquinol methylase
VEPEIAAKLSDAIMRKRHPRSDFRTGEAKEYTKKLRPFLKKAIFPSCKALDLGCSSGKLTFEMESLGAVVVGLDCSQEAIYYAREIAASLGSKAIFRIGTFCDIPYPVGIFDLVLFANIMECSYIETEQIIGQIVTYNVKAASSAWKCTMGLNDLLRAITSIFIPIF